ncbi:MAG: glycosyltransferase family 1 protein [Deltaproteobacteria bacterium]|nr:glycosyltransferase family 1 protein [Deltaproteobacteria bacterium]
MKLLLINQDWFADEFRAAGHEVLTCGVREHLQVRLTQPFEPIHNLIARLPGGFRPDRLIVYDESAPILISGVEDSEVPSLFYSVDIHHHFNVHKYLGHVFDAILVAQRDYLHYFEEVGVRAEWMPLWGTRMMEPSLEKKYGAVFVGTLQRSLNPARVEFFEKLQALVPIEVMTRSYWEIFPYSEIVVNQTVKGDLNFRVFEGMLSGALLLTEKGPNGLEELFKADQELVLYSKDNVEEAADIIRSLLQDIPRCRAIGAAGREAIMARHLPKHRASVILELLQSLEKRPSGMRHFAFIPNLSWAAKVLGGADLAYVAQAAGTALQYLDRGLDQGEFMPEAIALYATICCIEYDRICGGNLGSRYLSRMAEVFKAYPIFQVARIWQVAQAGEVELALQMSQDLSPGDPQQTLGGINNIIDNILGS